MNADFSASEAGRLIKTIAFLCERGNFGYAGLDDTYRAIWRHGALADWIPLGANVCQHTDLFFGLEKELLDLQDEHGGCVALPRVGIPTGGGEGSKISVETFWDDRALIYHVVVHRLVAESEVELELLKQIRARRLAEENFQSTREKLARKQMLLDIVMEHLPVAAAIFDERRRYLFATRRWAHDFKTECEPLIGQDVFEAGPAIPDGEKRRLEASLAGRVPGDGGTPGQRWTHKGWRHPEGAQGGVLTTVEDVAALAANGQKLELANEQLRAANRQIAHFAAIITHDLNAPLRSLLAMVDEVEMANPVVAGNGSAASIRDHVERMRNILDGMHDYLQVLCFAPVTRPVNVAGLVSEILAALPHRGVFGLRLSLKPEEITVNAGLLDLVLRNLLDNAIKHHDRLCGQLSISLDDQDNAWLIGMEDDGPGMKCAPHGASRQNGVLPVFAGRETRGGKGLLIIERALDAIGGAIEIQSDPPRKRGTKFVIRWPKTPSP
jgi:signal transduction histidine kinase